MRFVGFVVGWYVLGGRVDVLDIFFELLGFWIFGYFVWFDCF